MMRILIPSHSIDLTEIIQGCLLVAQKQGFDIDCIQVGVSPYDHFIVGSGDEQPVTIVDSRHASLTACSDVDYIVDYSQQLALKDVISCLSSKPNTIIIGVDDGTKQLDVWQDNTKNRALSFNRNSITDLDCSSHIAVLLTCLSLNFPIEDSLVLARAAMNVSRETWPGRFEQFPTPVLDDPRLGICTGWGASLELPLFPTLENHRLGLYPVVDSVDWIERLLKLGVKTLQLRIKNPQQADLKNQIACAIELGKQYQAQVYINDYWQLAIEYGAFGVHLGQEDIEQTNLSELTKAGICLGLSTHGYYELLRIVQISPTYIALGHIFPTTTKDMPSKPQGLTRLRLYQELIDTIPYGVNNERRYPTVAIGGIDQITAPSVWSCGVGSLAVVRAITLSSSPKNVIDDFECIMQEQRDVAIDTSDGRGGVHA